LLPPPVFHGIRSPSSPRSRPSFSVISLFLPLLTFSLPAIDCLVALRCYSARLLPPPFLRLIGCPPPRTFFPPRSLESIVSPYFGMPTLMCHVFRLSDCVLMNPCVYKKASRLPPETSLPPLLPHEMSFFSVSASIFFSRLHPILLSSCTGTVAISFF